MGPLSGATDAYGYNVRNEVVSARRTLGGSPVAGFDEDFAYDAAGRLVKEGSKTYRYGYLDKVLSVTDGKDKYTYGYHVDGQLASANYGGGKSEDFLWDGLALIQRGGARFINEPHIGGGNPVVSSSGTSYFNDVLGTTLGAKAKGKYSAAALSAFGEQINGGLNSNNSTLSTLNSQFFTGKPHVAGLGHAFLFRNYRAGLAKWQTADPLGYPDGWNRLAYCGNDVLGAVDYLGTVTYGIYDFYDRTKYVTSIYQLSINRGGSIPGSCDEQIYVYLDLITKTLDVQYYVGITISNNTILSSDVPIGEEVEYVTHFNKPNDASINDYWIYEAVLAHERGHADYCFSYQRPELLSSLSVVERLWKAGSISDDRARQWVDDIIANTTMGYNSWSGAMANQRTNGWFADSPDWILVWQDGRVWRWRKCE